MKIIHSKKELIAIIDNDRMKDYKITLIPTMGNLHQGHLSLVDTSACVRSRKIVSIFVNPLQFDNLSDFASYPKSLEEDLRVLERKKIDYVFVPEQEEMVDDKNDMDSLPWGFTNLLCGSFRGTHFDGVQKIVRKLFEIIKPDHAVFGEKDYQQYLLIKYITQRYFQENNIEIILSPTIRMKNGLVFSSRNNHLSEEQMNSASLAFQGIKNTVVDYFLETGLLNFDNLIPQTGKIIYQYVKIYNENYLFDKHGLESHVNSNHKSFRLFIALVIDNVRLIDNYPVEGYDRS